jgi:predicted DCC family thiol-disulfide oxidoreductase YuxK
MQSPEGEELLIKKGLSDKGLHTIIYIADGNNYMRSSAVLRILKDIGGGWRYLYVFIILPPFIRNFLYDLIARSRYYIFGKNEL